MSKKCKKRLDTTVYRFQEKVEKVKGQENSWYLQWIHPFILELVNYQCIIAGLADKSNCSTFAQFPWNTFYMCHHKKRGNWWDEYWCTSLDSCASTLSCCSQHSWTTSNRKLSYASFKSCSRIFLEPAIMNNNKRWIIYLIYQIYVVESPNKRSKVRKTQWMKGCLYECNIWN